MYSISNAAKKAEVKISTLRFYERKGFVKPHSKALNGYRRYSDEDVHKIVFIKKAQLLGFSLAEIKMFLAFSQGGKIKQKDVLRIATEKTAAIESKIKDLQRMKRAIHSLLMKTCDYADECPVILSLN